MSALSNDWLIKGLVDFEYKKYQLLAYLKTVKSLFRKNKLYPHMSQLLFHYQNMISIKEGKELMQDKFPSRITHADLSQMKVVYKKILEDDKVMKALSEIIDFAQPKLQDVIEQGKDIYDLVDDQMEITTVGITSLYTDEGYFFIQFEDCKDIEVFKYRLTVFTNPEGKHRGIHSEYLGQERKSSVESFKSLKLKVARRDKTLDNPATYLVTNKYSFPIKETLLPVSQRKLVQYIGINAA